MLLLFSLVCLTRLRYLRNMRYPSTFLWGFHSRMSCSPPSPGGRLPHKRNGGARRKVWKKLRDTKVLFRGRGFSPLRSTNNTLSPVIFFSARYLKRYRESFHCGPFEAEHTKQYQICLVCSASKGPQRQLSWFLLAYWAQKIMTGDNVLF